MQQPTDTSQNFHAGLNESGITAMQRGAVQTANRFANPEDLIYQISDSLFETKDIKDILTILQKLLKPYFVFEESAVAVLNHAKGGFDSFLSTGNNDPHLNGTLERIMLTEDVAHADTSNRAIRCQLINSDDLEASDWGLLRPLSSVTIDQIALFCISHKNIVYGIFLFASKKNVTYTVGLFRRFDLLFYSLAFSVSKILSYRDFSDMDRYDNSRNPDCDQSIDDEFAIPSTILEQNFAGIVGSSHEMQRVFTLLGKISGSDCTVLIHGETGTGKELIASAIHKNSYRHNMPMIRVNCAAIPATLIESELFGHEKGSFTGAFEQKIGKFELAHEGTLFLDEIGELPLELQSKILRAIQEKEIDRIGCKRSVKVDVRIIAASNRDLQKESIEGRFRTDLFYRLNVFPITLPPLRQRKEDIPNLTKYFVERFAAKNGKKITGVSQRVMKSLQTYDWPGNIRELEHLIERSILLNVGPLIKKLNLPGDQGKKLMSKPRTQFHTLEENERNYILAVLKHCKGKVYGFGGAAALLGIPSSTLSSKMRKLDIKRNHVYS